MSELNQGSWQPDPFGRFAQRYFDGNAWTANVIDASGHQSTDPPVSWVPTAATSSKRGPQPAALVLAGLGALFVLLSVFVLNWFDFSESDKADIRLTNPSTIKRDFGLSVSDVVDGLKFTELKTIADESDGNTLSGATDQYLSVGYILAVLTAVLGVVVLLSSGFQRPIAIIAMLFAGWHAHTVYEFMDDNTSAQFGAWLGAAGLAMVAVSLLLPRRQPAVAA